MCRGLARKLVEPGIDQLRSSEPGRVARRTNSMSPGRVEADLRAFRQIPQMTGSILYRNSASLISHPSSATDGESLLRLKSHGATGAQDEMADFEALAKRHGILRQGGFNVMKSRLLMNLNRQGRVLEDYPSVSKLPLLIPSFS